jgi:ribonucleoside-diphosphate reductase alpha chain
MSEAEKNEKNDWVRPRVLNGYTSIIQSGCGKLHVTVNFDGDNPVEVYARSSSGGGCEANTNCIGRIISRMLQLGCSVDDVLEQLHSTRCPTAMKNKDAKISDLAEHAIFIKSCPDGIARAIEIAIKLKEKDGKRN